MKHAAAMAVVLGVLIPRAPLLAAQGAPAGGLRIVVIEGEDAVNVVQQKTAVAPIVEVRDRNDQPVAGAVVRFAIRSGKATFGGPRTLVATTNSAGRAAVATLTPTGSGTVQITATAAFQGQTAAVTIAQTNVMTAAAASGASGGAGAGGAAGGGGGGVSATTVGIIGGAAAGGTLVTQKLLDHGTLYTGDVNGDMTFIFPAGTGCTRTHHFTGTLNLHLKVNGNNVDGNADADGSSVVTAVTCTGGPQLGATDTWGIGDPTPQIQGTTSNFTFTWTETSTFPATATTPPGTLTSRFDFSGSLANDVVTGTLKLTATIQNTIGGVTVPAGNGTGSFNVTLNK